MSNDSQPANAAQSIVQATQVTYELHTLGWKSFQDLAVAIAEEIIKRPVETFLLTRDGGRDGAFIGKWDGDPQQAQVGRSTIQCKFTSRRDAQLTLSNVSSELKKAENLVARGLADDYILITNYGVTGVNAAEIEAAFLAIGVKIFRVFGASWIIDQIRTSPRLRVMVPRVYGLGDLSQILDERAYAQSKAILSAMGDDLARFVITDAHRRAVRAVMDHQFVLLLGDPASGKSTIAASLAVGALDHWRSPTIRITSPDELTKHWNPEEQQFFWVDDAFGPTQYQKHSVDAWNRQLSLMATAIRRGARFLLTSRTYIWRSAHRELKTSAFPLFNQSQVVIDVQGLQPSEKAQILYNHIKLGDQPHAYRKAIKPYLAEVAADPSFLPETARRLGQRFFTSGLTLNQNGVLDFTRRPVVFLKDVLQNLDGAAAGAVGLIFMHGGAVPSPIESDERTDVISELLGVTTAELRASLQALHGSLVLLLEKPEGHYWTFKHPTIADAYASLVADSPELTEIYLRGAQYEKLLNEVVCGAVDIEGAKVRIPPKLYPILLNRLAAKPVDYRAQYFFAQRCDRDFLASAIKRLPAMLELYVTSHMAYSSETQLLAKLHKLDLLPEMHRTRYVSTIAGLTVQTPDGAVFRDDGIRSLFTDREFDELIARVKTDVVERLDDHVFEWKTNCSDDDDPDSYFDEFSSMLDGLGEQYKDDPDVMRRVANGRKSVKAAIVSLNDDRPESVNSKIETPTGRPAGELAAIGAIFEDVDQ